MKKILFAAFFFSCCFYQQLFSQELKSEVLFDFEAELNPPLLVGPVPTGTRVIFVAKSGVVKSKNING